MTLRYTELVERQHAISREVSAKTQSAADADAKMREFLKDLPELRRLDGTSFALVAVPPYIRSDIPNVSIDHPRFKIRCAERSGKVFYLNPRDARALVKWCKSIGLMDLSSDDEATESYLAHLVEQAKTRPPRTPKKLLPCTGNCIVPFEEIKDVDPC